MTYVDVILPVPLHGMFTYAVPEGMTVQVGVRVLVTFGRSKVAFIRQNLKVMR